ncbi:hypothetical protein Q9L58_010405 [Maublancomyces gigas]|uniref:Uncharacterized protein n=1 Tax=Discina gigas TaxID=1032678 RepID=A0ABR3G467_9PEZI
MSFLRKNMSKPATSRVDLRSNEGVESNRSKKTAAAAALKEQCRKRVVLIKLAHSRAQHTKVAISSALREVGLAGTPVNVERVLSLRADADCARRHRYRNRANARIVTPVTALPEPSGRPAVPLPPAMDAPAGIALYAAVWACQDWGYSVKTQRGFIAVGVDDESFHAETSEKAIAGLLGKYSIGKKASPRLLT